jgi:cold shock CspA family protein
MSKAEDKRTSSRLSARLPAGNARKEVTGTPSRGAVSRMAHGQSHGYIRMNGGGDVFFHRSDTAQDLFNQLEVGVEVTFELIEDRISGARAINVRRPPATKRA